MSAKILIVDDEPLARDTIRLLIEDRMDCDVIGECANGEEAVSAIIDLKPDVVFLDIQMPGMTGFDVIETIGPEKMPKVVFATAYDEYALRAFDAQAVDYLLKPFDDDRFDTALTKALRQVEKNRLGTLNENLAALLEYQKSLDTSKLPAAGSEIVERIMVKERDSVFFVKTEDIDYITAAGDYVTLHVAGKSHLIRDTMTRMDSKLDPNLFARIHRSTIVNVDRIKELRPYFHGDYIVYLKGGKELRLSRRYWDRLEAVIGSDAG